MSGEVWSQEDEEGVGAKMLQTYFEFYPAQGFISAMYWRNKKPLNDTDRDQLQKIGNFNFPYKDLIMKLINEE